MKKPREFTAETLAPYISQIVQKRFWSYVRKGGSDDCWPWFGFIHHITGYGQIKILGKKFMPHVLSYYIHYGPTNGMNVLHRCIGNRVCCNPKHLYAGTQKENARDMIEQGRFRVAIGEDCGSAVLTEDNVRQMRLMRAPGLTRQTAPITYKEIGKIFGVGWGTARQVVEHLTWKHLT